MRQISHVEALSSTVPFGVRFNLSHASENSQDLFEGELNSIRRLETAILPLSNRCSINSRREIG
jgi:hypothetical protein